MKIKVEYEIMSNYKERLLSYQEILTQTQANPYPGLVMGGTIDVLLATYVPTIRIL